MPLEYYVENKDTGFNYKEAIQPVKNGEDANEDTFERPSENLRTRTEDVRTAFDLLEAVVASDRGLTVVAAADAYVSWDSVTGKFDVNDNGGTPSPRDFYIMPLLGLAEGSTGAPGANAPATYVYYDSVGGGAFITETNATLRDHGDTGAGRRSGANNVFVRVDESTRTTGGVVISVEGDDEVGPTFPADGPVVIVIELEQGGNTAAEIVAALQAAGDHDTYLNIGALYTKVLAVGDCTKEVTRRRLADGDVYDDGGGNIYHSFGAMDPEGILIENTALTSFFGTAGNELDEGDVLVVNFTGADDRLNNQTDSTMTGMLKKLTSDALPDRNTWLASRRHVVPICKVFDGNLYFLNGTMFESGKPGRLIPDPGDIVELRDEYGAHVAGTADKHADADITAEAHAGTGNPAVTTLPVTLPGSSEVRTHIDELLKTIDRHMDATVANFQHPDGDITAAAKSDSPRSLTVGDVNSQLVEMLGHYNHHVNAGDGPLDKHDEAHVTATAKIRDKFTLSGTDVAAQLGELATIADDHIDGSNAAYQHPYMDILDRPLITVGNDSAAHDYTSLGAAVIALSSVGGGVIILLDDLVENVNITAVAPGTLVLGNGHSITGASGLAPVISVDGQTAEQDPGLIFQDLNILAGYDQKLVETSTVSLVTAIGAPENMPVTFRNCFFQTLNTGTAVAFLVYGTVNLFECTVEGQAQTRATFEFNTHATFPQQYPSVLHVENCRVNNFLQLVSVGSPAARYQTLRVIGCILDACVYSDGSNNRVLIDLGTSVQEEVVVVRNRILSANGMFIKCTVNTGYPGIVADNVFNSTYAQDVEEMYAIQASKSGGGTPFLIRGNYLSLNYKLCGIYSAETARIEDNYLTAFGHNASSGITKHYGIRVDDDGGNVWVEGNKIVGAATTLTGTDFVCIEVGVSGGSVRNNIHINNNEITAPVDYQGIRVYDTEDTHISGNIVGVTSMTVSAGRWAINVSGCARVTIAQNVCNGWGISIGSDNVTCVGNTVTITSTTASAIGVYGDNVTVSGCNLTGGTYSIFVDAGSDHYAITGNNIVTTGTYGVYINSAASTEYGVMTGNVVTGVAIALYVANNCYLGLSGNTLQKDTNYAVDVPAVSNNIGVGSPGSCTWDSDNWWSSKTAH